MTSMTGYIVVLGDSWTAAHQWSRDYPHEPFVGIRVDDSEIWIAVEPKASDGPLPVEVIAEIERVLQTESWETSAGHPVILYQARTLREAHRLARTVVSIIRSVGASLRAV